MKIIKYCEEKYNTAKSCNTLKLGTYQEYREMDPSFSIADIREGFIHYSTDLDQPITISSEAYNSITGGSAQIIDNNNQSSPRYKHPGHTEGQTSGVDLYLVKMALPE